jgi:hypothetical protein
MKGISVNTCCIILIVLIVIILIRAFTNEGRLWGGEEYYNIFEDEPTTVVKGTFINNPIYDKIKQAAIEEKEKQKNMFDKVKEEVTNMPNFVKNVLSSFDKKIEMIKSSSIDMIKKMKLMAEIEQERSMFLQNLSK